MVGERFHDLLDGHFGSLLPPSPMILSLLSYPSEQASSMSSSES